MKLTDLFLALIACLIYRLFWVNLSAERRFILRNKLL